ncbi:uncharacterized protein PHACADRAFT_183079 [Phanerochaete carnosa HHB-10118-sp]|uniref:Uncharacterized protein n=1 Tax=Phanerochaete carnosa (strain HHB-10118-sp) TaxID=650164 RepID=K5WBN9_PHACS|nr:uncharacterized protein PHACADRAFT_183079 [Phanerochaete carnosa HHB-10118-sp]EKM56384.1 hypothetical protein PHACADRAFT_183079 [Phanerochaete carnosa HHB-10118-sp]
MFHKGPLGFLRLDAAGLIALADLKSIARRTALIGSASVLDVLYLAPGIHRQQDAAEISGGEYPQAGTMHKPNCSTFRIENPATVSFLQSVGKPGHLTTIRVSRETTHRFGLFGELFRSEFWASVLFLFGIAAAITVIVLLGVIQDWWALGVLGMLMLARVLNDKYGFKGHLKKAGDPQSDIMIDLSQCRWIRMRGGVIDIKQVTAGQWMREPEAVESFAVSFGTLLVYGSAAVAGNTTTVGSLLVGCLLLFNAGVLGLANAATHSLHIFDRVVAVEGEPVRYERRLDMVRHMIRETKHSGWALRMGMITEPELEVDAKRDEVLELPGGTPELGINKEKNSEKGLSGSETSSAVYQVEVLPSGIV